MVTIDVLVSLAAIVDVVSIVLGMTDFAPSRRWSAFGTYWSPSCCC